MHRSKYIQHGRVQREVQHYCSQWKLLTGLKTAGPIDLFLSCHSQQYFTSPLVQEFKVCKIHLEWLLGNLVNLDLNCQILHKHILSFYKRSVCKSSCIGTEAVKEICFTLPVYLRRWQQHSKLIRYSFPLNPYSQEKKSLTKIKKRRKKKK